MKEKKKKTIRQSKEWSLVIETYNKETEEIDITLEQVIDKIKHETHYYFGINHDKDTTEDGELKREHLHIVLKLKTKITLNGILRKLETLLEIDRNRISAEITRNQILVIRYLLHLDNPEKNQYAPFEVITNREDILNQAIKGEDEREDLTAENLIITVEKHGGNRLKIMSDIGLKNYNRFRGTITDIMEELEIRRLEQATITARNNIQTERDMANTHINATLKSIDKKIDKRLAEIEKKVINNKAVELLNKKKNRL